MAHLRNNLVFGALASAWGALSAAGVALAIILAAPFMGGRQAFNAISGWWIRQQLALLGVTWSVEGWDRVWPEIRDGRRSAVFMPNHQSQLDPPFLAMAVPAHPVFIAKKELLWMPVIGWAMALSGTIFIDRGSRERSVQSLKRAAQRIRDGINVLIFPEGTRTRTGELLAFKKGGFHLAADAGVPIVPIAITGAYQVLPKGTYIARPGHIRLVFGEPVDTQAYPDRASLQEEVRRRMEALLAQP